jgi:hypothetical protein
MWRWISLCAALLTEQDAVLRRLKTHDAMQAGTTALYNVEVNFDIESLNPGSGVTMYFDKPKHEMRLDVGFGTKEGLAWGGFADKISSTGWAELRVSGQSGVAVANSPKMYAAGYVEGLLTCIRISEYYHNTHQLVLQAEKGHHSLLAVKTQLVSQMEFLKANVNLVEHIWPEEPTDPRWRHGRYILFQLWGMMDGYNYAARHFKVHTLSLVDFFLLNSMGEIATMMTAYEPAKIADRAKAQSPPLVFLQKQQRHSGLNANATKASDQEEETWRRRVVKEGHCSALVRITEGYGDLLVGHTTWADYSTMTRIWKYYTLPLPNAKTMATTISMSSYPGTITSGDNFFMADSGLVVTDTSLEMVNPFGFDAVKDFPFNAHLPNFMHVLIVLRQAKNAPDFAEMLQTQNTGTLMAQWMVVDYNLFKPGKPPPQNLLWVIEQVPGAQHAEDMSLSLRLHGFWGSANRPFFTGVRDVSGFSNAQKSHGFLYSASDCPRCRILSGAAPGVNSLYDMRGLINRNLYPIQANEPFLPGHEISARFDLDPKEPIPNGGIDSKIASNCMFKSLTAQITSGPSHSFLAPFKWTNGGRESFPGSAHVGQPDEWNFGWVQISPAGSTGIVDVDAC